MFCDAVNLRRAPAKGIGVRWDENGKTDYDAKVECRRLGVSVGA